MGADIILCIICSQFLAHFVTSPQGGNFWRWARRNLQTTSQASRPRLPARSSQGRCDGDHDLDSRIPDRRRPCPRTLGFLDTGGSCGSTVVGSPTLSSLNRSSAPPPISDREFDEGCQQSCNLFATLVGHQVKGRASAEPSRYKSSAHTSAYRNHDVKYIGMAAESGSTDLSDFFYEVRVSFVYLLCFYSQNLVPVRVSLYRSRGHLSPNRPSIIFVLRSTKLHIPIRFSGESARHALKSEDYTGLLPPSSLRPRPADLFTSDRHPCQR